MIYKYIDIHRERGTKVRIQKNVTMLTSVYGDPAPFGLLSAFCDSPGLRTEAKRDGSETFLGFFTDEK